jgi:hypothetical protein
MVMFQFANWQTVNGDQRVTYGDWVIPHDSLQQVMIYGRSCLRLREGSLTNGGDRQLQGHLFWGVKQGKEGLNPPKKMGVGI